MQVLAIIDAAIEATKGINGKKVSGVEPEIMLPIIATTKEFTIL